MTMDAEDEQFQMPRELSKGQRRILGVLMEKGMTTPEYYPMTVKALVAGANQKSNRNPLTSYNEEQVLTFADELQELGLLACVHTQGGRTERFRHYMRRHLQLSDPQFAILAELLLRGRQQMGELRTRANRMRTIQDQQSLRSELKGLMECGLVVANGSLERRGVEIDHCLYRDAERQNWDPDVPVPDEQHEEVPVSQQVEPIPQDVASELRQQQQSIVDLQAQLANLREICELMQDEIRSLKQQLGI